LTFGKSLIHNARMVEFFIDWAQADWAYLLGVIHGDGSIASRSISITVGGGDSDYLDVLVGITSSLGLNPKLYRAANGCHRLDVNGQRLRDEIAPFKSKGRWRWPSSLNIPHYLAGVFDTDGSVSSSVKNIQIVLILKRGGNLKRLAKMINGLGIGRIEARDTRGSLRGAEYLTETIRLSGKDRIEDFSRAVELRHPKKKAKLDALCSYIRQRGEDTPMWRKVATRITGKPLTLQEIMAEFELTEDQVKSILSILRKKGVLKFHPPTATRYFVEKKKRHERN